MPTTEHPMPAVTCPTWCTADHAQDWQRIVDACAHGGQVKHADGQVVTLEPATYPELARLFEPSHSRKLADVDLGQGLSYELSITDDEDRGLIVYLYGEAILNAEQARQAAAALLNAADVLDGLSS